MAEESNVHIKLAGAEVLGLFLVSMIAILVGMFGLGVFDDYAPPATMGLGVILAVAAIVGWGLVICTIVAYLNENILVSAAFGLFAVYLLGFAGMAGMFLAGESMQAEIYTIFFGLGLLMIGVVSFAQPVKILPIFLIIAALAFVCLGLWFDMGDDIKMVVGILWTIASLLALYMATAIAFLVVKGKQVLPLLVKA